MLKTISHGRMSEESFYNSEDHYQVKDFMLVQRVIRKINSILDLKELLMKIIEDISKTLGFEKCGVLLYDEYANQLELVALTGWDDNIRKAGDRFNLGEGIIWRSFAEQKMIYYPDINECPEEMPCDFASHSHVDIPLMSKNKVIGILNAQHKEKDGFSIHNLRILKTLGEHLSVAIQNARLFEKEKREKELMMRDLKEANAIQRKLFPKNSPVIQNFRISGMCEPCHEVGGDWYDYIELPSGKIGVVLADVAGKGLAASLLMASARTIIRMIALQEESPAKLLKKVSAILSSDMPSSRFITLVYVVIDPQTRAITVANAGHQYPVIYSDRETGYLVMEAGLPLGIKEYPYKEYNYTMNKSDRLLLYSDGVPEAMNSKKDMFGEERLIPSMKKPGADIHTLYNDVKEFVEFSPLNDDLTIVMIEAI
jgi:sigma-B regulation protein RsbU (phosphoserine phosphatase)